MDTFDWFRLVLGSAAMTPLVGADSSGKDKGEP